jgi:hypothetical protein
VASASADRTLRIDLATLVGVGLIGLALYVALRDLSLLRVLLEMPYVSGFDVLVSTPEVLAGLVVPAIGLTFLAVALGYALVFGKRSRSVALVASCTISLLYWSAGVAFAAVGICLVGAIVVLDVVSARGRSDDKR